MKRSTVASVALLVLAVSGCDGLRGPEAEPEREPVARTCKMDAGLALRFRAPELVRAGVELSLALEIAGAPGESVAITLSAPPAVALSVDRGELRLDETGTALFALGVVVPEADGCQILAQVRRADGREQQLGCILGKASEPPRNFARINGRRVRVDR